MKVTVTVEATVWELGPLTATSSWSWSEPVVQSELVNGWKWAVPERLPPPPAEIVIESVTVTVWAVVRLGLNWLTVRISSSR